MVLKDTVLREVALREMVLKDVVLRKVPLRKAVLKDVVVRATGCDPVSVGLRRGRH